MFPENKASFIRNNYNKIVGITDNAGCHWFWIDGKFLLPETIVIDPGSGYYCQNYDIETALKILLEGQYITEMEYKILGVLQFDW